MLAAVLLPATATQAEAAEAFEFLRLPLAARTAALGGSGVAAADDWAGSQWNPAALGRIARGEAVFGGAKWLVESRHQALGAALPVGARGGVSLTLFSLDYGDVPAFDGAGQHMGDAQARDSLARLGYGQALTDRLWLGAAGAYAEEKLGDHRARTWAGDTGVIWSPRQWPGGSLGASVRNLGPGPKFDRERGELPRTYQAGASWQAFDGGLTINTDALWTDGESSLLTGVEYWARGAVAFRAGYDGRPAKDGAGVTAGLGFRAWDLVFDYAYTAYGDLGDAHHLTLSYRFGSVAQAHYERGMAAMRRGDYARAVLHFGRAIAADPSHRRALARLKEANARLQQELKPAIP